MKRVSYYYVLALGMIVLGIAGVLHLGASLPPPTPAAAASLAETPPSGTLKQEPLAGSAPKPATASKVEASIWSGVAGNLKNPLSHLFLQLLLIIAASRVMAKIFTRMGQPAVVGEMAAGILLGPSLFGLLAPGAFSFVFPESSVGTLKLFSQIGVCLFMFTVGMEVNWSQLRGKAQTALVVSNASIVIPYLLGVALAYILYTDLAAVGTRFTPFALFMGISISITAFPVLARILRERQMTQTFLGQTALTCAAVNDVTAWCILAFVVAIASASSLGGAAVTFGLTVLFIAVMITIVRKSLPRWLGKKRLEEETPSKGTMAAVLWVVVLAALSTEIIGIHALFGAFLAGAVMPDAKDFRHKIDVRVENFSSVLFLPLFFAYTGLRTQIGLLNDLDGWLLCLLIIVVATIGKLGGSAVTARFTGMNWSESLQLGALMNTRGLMELIALNIGYDLGILSPRIFTMLVIMALATTMMTGPLLTLFGAKKTVDGDLPAPSRA